MVLIIGVCLTAVAVVVHGYVLAARSVRFQPSVPPWMHIRGAYLVRGYWRRDPDETPWIDCPDGTRLALAVPWIVLGAGPDEGDEVVARGVPVADQEASSYRDVHTRWTLVRAEIATAHGLAPSGTFWAAIAGVYVAAVAYAILVG